MTSGHGQRIWNSEVSVAHEVVKMIQDKKSELALDLYDVEDEEIIVKLAWQRFAT